MLAAPAALVVVLRCAAARPHLPQVVQSRSLQVLQVLRPAVTSTCTLALAALVVLRVFLRVLVPLLVAPSSSVAVQAPRVSVAWCLCALVARRRAPVAPLRLSRLKAVLVALVRAEAARIEREEQLRIQRSDPF